MINTPVTVGDRKGFLPRTNVMYIIFELIMALAICAFLYYVLDMILGNVLAALTGTYPTEMSNSGVTFNIAIWHWLLIIGTIFLAIWAFRSAQKEKQLEQAGMV